MTGAGRVLRAQAANRTITTVVATFLILVLALYAIVLYFYSAGQVLKVEPVRVADSDVTIAFDLVDIAPTEYSGLLRSNLIEAEASLVDANDRLTQDVRVGVWTNDGADEVFFPAGSLVGRAEASIGIDGDISSYPFDSYSAVVEVDAFSRVSSDAPWEQLRIQPQVVGGIPGWDVAAVMEPQSEGWVTIEWTAERAFSEKFFALLTVALGFSIAAFSFAVGAFGLAGRRTVEAGVLGFGAAVIFSLLALRNYLPGQPPIGIGLDIHAYLWITLTAFVAMALIVVAWMMDRARKK